MIYVRRHEHICVFTDVGWCHFRVSGLRFELLEVAPCSIIIIQQLR
jgi:hypothetical protein